MTVCKNIDFSVTVHHIDFPVTVHLKLCMQDGLSGCGD